MSRHNGINATRDVLKDQLALAADAKIHDHINAELTMAFLRARLRRPASPWPIRAACAIGFAIGLFVGVAL